MLIEAASQYRYLWLLLIVLVVPILTFVVFRKRLWLSVWLRMLVCVLLVLALVDLLRVQTVKNSDVILLVDQSDSLGPAQKQQAWEFARSIIKQPTLSTGSHRVGVVLFGKDVGVEQPLIENAELNAQPEIKVDGSRSQLADALKFSGTLFDRPAYRRILVVSDGASTEENWLDVANNLYDRGIEINVARVMPNDDQDIIVERIESPNRSAPKVPIPLTIKLRNLRPQPNLSSSGKLQIRRTSGTQTSQIAELTISELPESEILTLQDTTAPAGMLVYEALFTPDDPRSDLFSQNNRASTMCEVVDKNKILIISMQSEIEALQVRLRPLIEQGLSFEFRTETETFQSIADLIQFDAVWIANVPRIQQTEDLPVIRFSDEQLSQLNQYVNAFGGGLLMTGGPNAFGAGGWMNSAVEDAMPVKFKVDDDRVVASCAIALVIDKSGSMTGDKILMCQSAAVSAISMLNDSDYVGVYPFDSGLSFPISMRKVGSDRSSLNRKIKRIAASGGTDMTEALDLAYKELRSNDASVKHVILLTDGQSYGKDFARLAAAMKAKDITTTAVSVGSDADDKLLMSIAQRGGGRFYQVDKSSMIPKIFIKEARLVSRPLIQEFEGGVPTFRNKSHEVTQGIADKTGLIRGLVLTTLRDNVLSEQLIRSNQPEKPNDTVLAVWQYGAGRTAAWMTDLGERWAADWSASGEMDQVLTQAVRWIGRSSAKNNHFLQVDNSSNLVKLKFQWDPDLIDIPSTLPAVVVGVETSETFRIQLQRTGPRSFEAIQEDLPDGNYVVAIELSNASGVFRQGFTVSDSREFDVSAQAQQQLINAASLGSSNALGVSTRSETLELLEKSGRWLSVSTVSDDWSEAPIADITRPTVNPDRNSSSTWSSILVLAAGIFLAEMIVRKFGWDRLLNSRRSNASLGRQPVRGQPDRGRPSKKDDKPDRGTSLTPEADLSYTERLLRTKKSGSSR
ncbi:MAG: VWA domain-containing protein [Pirellula sp.]|jgi:uncharacterized membrane protein|nr:VWA domain-containing protein [Pirellula sp.]